MEILELKVQVDRGQLTTLQADIAKLKSQTIKISVDASGFNALDKATMQNIRGVTQYVKAVNTAERQTNQLAIAQQKTAQATQKAIAAEQKRATQVAKTSTVQAQTILQAEKTRTEQAKAAVQAEKTATANAKAAAAAQKVGTASATAAKSTKALGDSIGNIALKMAGWQIMGELVSKPIAAFKEAIQTMKEVDSELVNIQKVTGATDAEMGKLTERAYEMASAYGRTATEVLSASTEFARAGYGGQIEELSELSILLQNIGDISSDTANKFLLSVDAAWKLNGSEKDLMAVMDGLNEITNRNATDMDKLATGMTVAASYFAESGESIQTFGALMGAGTALTQRSGAEIGRALKAVTMNIRQVRGETEDGELINDESIAKAASALKEFAGISTMQNGELRLTSEVLDELAGKWDSLSQVRQSAIAEALGGKYHSNVVMALMGDWEMVEKMMSDYADGAGSALRENEIYMDSWEAKSKKLSSTWTEFISHMVETDAIKGALDGTTAVIEALDTELGRFVVTTGLVAAGLTLLERGGSKAFKAIASAGGDVAKPLGKMISLGKEIPNFASSFAAIAKQQGTITAFSQSIEMLTGVMAKNPLFAGTLVVAGAVGIAAIIDSVTTTVDEQREKVAQLQAEYDNLTGPGSEYDNLSSRAGELTTAEKNRLAILEAQTAELERQLQLAQDKEFERFQAEQGSGAVVFDGSDRYRTSQSADVAKLSALTEEQNRLNKSFQEGAKSEEEYRDGLQSIISEQADYYEALVKYKEQNRELTESQYEFIEAYELMLDRLSNTQVGDMGIRLAFEEFDGIFKTIDGEVGKTVVNVEALRNALEAAGAPAEAIEKTLSNMDMDDTVVTFDVKGNTEEALGELEELGIAIRSVDGQSVSINYDSFVEMARAIGLSNDEIVAFIGQASAVDGVSFSNAAGEAITLQEALSGLSSVNFVSPESIVSGVSSGVEASKGELGELSETEATPTVTLEGADEAIAAADNVKSSVDAIPKSKTVTITIQQNGSVPNIPPRAVGDKNFAGGTVLLGDQYSPTGQPMPELVITKGSAFIAGADGPEIRNLPAGSQILPYSETKKVLARSQQSVGSIPAFASGTDLWKYYYGTGSSGGSGGTSSGSGGSSSGGSSGRRTSSSGGSSVAGGGTDWDGLLKLLESELKLMEAQGKSAAELAAKMREIQAALHGQAEYMRSIGAEQAEINELSTEWWNVHEDILDAYRDEMKNERDLLRSQLELMENQNRSAGDRIAKLREIQANLQEEIELMQELGASQKEIIDLTNDWYDVQEEIAQVQRDLWAELEDAVEAQLKQARKVRDERLEALDKELEALRKAREEKQDQVTLEEKLLAVEEARIALANAQNERTVRTFNMETGQWEWVADARNVKDAEEALEDAKKSLAEYEEELAYEAAVAEIEAKKEAIEEAYNALEEEWERITDSLQAPSRTISSILDDIAQHGTPQMKAQIENVNVMLGKLNEYIAGAISGDPFGSLMGGYGDAGSGKPSLGQPWDYSKDPRDFSELMANAKTYPEYMYWAQQRENKIKQLGIDVEGSGYQTNDQIHEKWYKDHFGESSYIDEDGTLWAEVGKDGKAPTDMSPGDIVMTAGGNYKITGYNDDGSYKSEKIADSSVSDFVTTPTSDAEFNSRMADLQYRSGNTPERTSSIAGSSNSSVVNDHSGNEYHYGNITLTDSQASSMTVKELAQKASALSIYSNT